HGAAERGYGVIDMKADTLVDRESRNVYLVNLKPEVRFPGMDESKSKPLAAMVNEALTSQGMITVALDRVLACVQQSTVKAKPVEVNLDPPPIYYSDSPAILVIYRGAPQFRQVPGTQLNFA